MEVQSAEHDRLSFFWCSFLQVTPNWRFGVGFEPFEPLGSCRGQTGPNAQSKPPIGGKLILVLDFSCLQVLPPGRHSLRPRKGNMAGFPVLFVGLRPVFSIGSGIMITSWQNMFPVGLGTP